MGFDRGTEAIVKDELSGGYHMKEVFDTIFEITLENLKKYRVGEALRNQVDRKVGY